MSTNSTTTPLPPIRNGSFTSFIISPTAENMCDLYNSFLDVDLSLMVKLNAANAANVYTSGNGEEEPEAVVMKPVPDNQRSIWVVYKDAMDSIESYQIIEKAQSIDTHNYEIEESCITIVLGKLVYFILN
jgi:hypothetical protein